MSDNNQSSDNSQGPGSDGFVSEPKSEKAYSLYEQSDKKSDDENGTSIKGEAQDLALKKGRDELRRAVSKPVAGGTGTAAKSATSAAASSAAGSAAGDVATGAVGSAAAGNAAAGAASSSGAGIAGAAVGEVKNIRDSVSEGDAEGVVDSGVRVAGIAAATYFGGNAGGAAASAVLNTEVGRKTTRGVSKILIGAISFALLFIGLTVTITISVTVAAMGAMTSSGDSQVATCRGGPVSALETTPQTPTLNNTGPNITVVKNGVPEPTTKQDASLTVGTCFTSTFTGEATVPIGGTLQPDGSYSRIPGTAISDTYMGHKGRYNGSPGALDIAAPMNTPILAATDGVVTSVTSRETGNGITVQVSQNVKVIYWHAETVYVKPGDAVQAGQLIALVGTTGNSTGPHLHFGVYVDGVDVDPQTFFLPKGIDFYKIFGKE